MGSSFQFAALLHQQALQVAAFRCAPPTMRLRSCSLPRCRLRPRGAAPRCRSLPAVPPCLPQAAFCELVGAAAGYGYLKWLIADVDRYQPGDVIPARQAGAR